MKITSNLLIISLLPLALACNGEEEAAEAYGNFEATEIIVAAEGNGRIMHLSVEEGQQLKEGQLVGLIDTSQLYLQKEQVRASIQALGGKTLTVREQLAVWEDRKANLLRERKRVESLLKDEAATTKQLDDIKGEIEVVESQMLALRTSINTQNRGIMGEVLPLEKKIDLLNDQIAKSLVKVPVAGTVLTQYAEPGEVATFGKPLFKLADLEEMYLRVYVSGAQLPSLKIGQEVSIRVDDGAEAYREMDGKISWIATNAEFTPKIIQTKEERVNLVYAVKIRVVNDGTLKIGMPGELVGLKENTTATTAKK